MATGGLYGQSSAGIVSPQSGSESSGLYGNNTVFGGSYFEWFIFQVADVQPSTPTGGSWDFTTNTGIPPSGWLASPPVNPTNTVWVSVGVVSSKNNTAIVWSEPGKFSFASGLPILSGTDAPVSGDGQSDQLYIETGTTPETIWFKQAGTWTRLTGSSLYMDLTSSQTIAGTKTFSSEIQGSVSGTSSNVTGIVDITHGGTGSTTASAARTALGLGSAAVLTAGAANGVATLDAGGTVPLSQIPASIQGGVSYQGTWNATTNSPTLTSSVGTKGYYYVVSTAGSTNLNGITTWNIGDWAIFNGTAWEKIDNTDAVTSVNGYTGTVVLNASDVGALASITSADGSITVSQVGTAVDLAVSAASPASTLLLQVRNSSGATMTKGTVVYVNGATGQLPTIAKALATSDATSAQTQGLVTADISNNSNGYVTIIGLVTNLDTSAYSDGAQLYLSGVTAGAMTATKPYAPIHLVYVGVVTHAHPTQGKIQVKVQNGYELDELHNVSAQTPSNGQTIVYNSSTQLWEQSNAPVISGTTINNTTIGATTASTGAFTTLTTSSTVTHSAGTANGVAYLNGSKVLTTGSALVFDGTNLGIGTSSPSAKLDVSSGSLGGAVIIGGDVNTSTGARTDATRKYAVVGSYPYTNANRRSTIFVCDNDGTDNILNVGGGQAQLNAITSMRFYTGATNNTATGTERMRIDSSGNLGLGVTPSAWASNYKAVDISPIGAVYSVSGFFGYQTNAYFNGTNNIYKTTGYATDYYSTSGTHVWRTAASGTAGNTISFTTAMTLDASGNLFVGATSGSGLWSGSEKIIKVKSTSSDAAGVQVSSSNAQNTSVELFASYLSSEVGIAAKGDSAHQAVVFGSYSGATYVERARIDSSGNLLVGCTSGDPYRVKLSTNSGTTTWGLGPYVGTPNNFYVVNAATGTGVYISSGSTSWSTVSDERSKTALVPFENAAQKVCSLRAGTGRYLIDEETVSRSFLIAQDVQAVLPEAVNVQEDEQGTLGLSYTDLIPLLTAAIQEQQAIIESLKARLDAANL